MKLSEEAKKFAKEAAGGDRGLENLFYTAFMLGAVRYNVHASDWLKSKLQDDHIDTNHGVGCVIPDMILCEEYFKVDDLLDAMKEQILI